MEPEIWGRIQKARLGGEGWVGKGIRGAEGAEAERPKA